MQEFKKNFVASLVKKHTINSNTFMFSHVKTITGQYDEKNGLFLSDDGSAYDSIDNINSNNITDEFYFNNAIQMYQLKKESSTSPSVKLSDVIKEYNKNNIETLVFLNFDNDMVESISINKNAILNLGKDVFDIEAIEDIESQRNFYEEIILDLTSEVINGDYTLEQLEEIKSDVLYLKEALESLSFSIDVEKETQSRNLKDTKEEIVNRPNRISIINKINKENKIEKKTRKIVEKDELIENNSLEKNELIDIDKLFKQVTNTLKAQDKPARRLIVEIARMNMNNHEKNGIMLTGSTGVGKTKLLSLISKYLNRPMIIIDSTQLTSPGYVGKDIEDYLWDLYESVGKDKDKAEKAIVFFDEIDKKGSESKSDVSGRAVLNVLLKFLDGTDYDICQDRKTSASKIKINTSNMIIIAGGAFSDVYEVKEENQIGFSKQENENKKVEIDDFINKAMIPKEFMARFPVFIHLNDLDAKALKEILEESIESPIKNEQETFKKLGVKLTYTSDYIDEVVRNAIAKKTGARSLKGIIADSTWDAFDKISSNNIFDEVILSKETLEDNTNYKLVKRK